MPLLNKTLVSFYNNSVTQHSNANKIKLLKNLSLLILLTMTIWSVSALSAESKIELADAIAKRQEEIKNTEAGIQKLEANREALLKESRAIETQIKRRGLKDEAKASTRALETAREMYAKTREYNNLQQTMDSEQTKAFTDWCINKGIWLVGEKTKKDWDATPEAQKLRQEQKQKLDGSYEKWKSEMDRLANKGSKGFGIDDSVVEEQDQKQKDNLEAFRKNDEELDKLKKRLEELKNMTDHDFQKEQEKPKETEDEGLKPDHEFFGFFPAERSDRDTNVKLNESKQMEFGITGGVPPYTITMSSISGEDNRTINVARRPDAAEGEKVKIPVTFSKPGTRSMEFACTEGDGRTRRVTIVFYVSEDEAKDEKSNQPTDQGKTEDEQAKAQAAEENLKKALAEAQGFITKARTAESTATAKIAQIQNAITTANNAESRINAIIVKLQDIPTKITELNKLVQDAQSASSTINGTTLKDDITSLYAQAKAACSKACDISANMYNSRNQQADVQLAQQAAAEAETASQTAKGKGSTALTTASTAESSLTQLSSIRQQMQTLSGNIEGIKAEHAEISGLVASASETVAGVSGFKAEIQTAIGEIDANKNSALGVLSPWSARPEAQALIGQANAIGNQLKTGESSESLIQGALATLERIRTLAESAGKLAGATVPAFPVDTGALEQKTADIRATAETMDLLESRITAEAATARSCAESAQSTAESAPNRPIIPPPAGWSPTGESISGPSAPDPQTQATNFGSATQTITNKYAPPTTTPPETPPNSSTPTDEGHHNPGSTPTEPMNPGTYSGPHYPGDPDGCT